MTKTGSNNTSKLVCYIVSFVMCLSLMAISIGAFQVVGVASERTFDKAVEKSQFISQSYGQVESQLNKYAKELKMPKTVLKDTVDYKQFRKDLNKSIGAGLQGNIYKADGSNAKKQFIKNVDDYLNYEMIVRSDELKTRIDMAGNNVARMYEQKANFEFPYYFSQYKGGIKKAGYIFLGVGAALLILTVILLKALSQTTIEALRFSIYGISGAILISLGLMVLWVREITGIGSKMENYYESFVSQFAAHSMAVGIIMLVLMAFGVLGCLYAIKKRK